MSKLKYSIEVDVYFSKTILNKVLRELFYPFRAQKNFTQQYGFLDGQASQYGPRLDWWHDEFRQSLCKIIGPKPVLFVSKAIQQKIEYYFYIFHGNVLNI